MATQQSTPLPRQVKDITGQRFGRLVVIRFSHVSKTTNGGANWVCRCDCGTETIVQRSNLLRTTVSCGCYSRERSSRDNRKHGRTFTPEYYVWRAMKKRCYNKNRDGYEYYGGRGITVCERWADSFENFLTDMGPRPSPRHSLDRINNNGHYEPGNCRWATWTEQARNRRKPVKK